MKKETRNITFRNLEIRSTESEGKKFIEGIIPYNSKSVPMWGTTEIIDRTAFNKTLADKTEVRALWNHNDSFILGNTKSDTLILENSDNGLICRCELPNTSYAADLYEIISRGDVKTMSFGFIPVKWTDSDKGKTRTLKEVELLECSFGVTFPAYPETNSQTFMRGFMKNNIDIENINQILEKDNLEKSDIEILKRTISEIDKIIQEKTFNENSENENEAVGKQDRTTSNDTSNGDMEKENMEKAAKNDIVNMIDLLFENEKLN
jgi:HK97 family phage prohead protease